MTTVAIADNLNSNGSEYKNKNKDGKDRPKPAPIIYATFEAAQELAEKIISKHHHEIASANILYFCRTKSMKRAGVPVPGIVRKAGPIEKELSRNSFNNEEGAHMVMIIALDVWNDLQPLQRTALVDHLLTRCVGEEDEKDGSMKYSVRAPQVQEFPEIAERHGKWNDGLAELGNSLRNK